MISVPVLDDARHARLQQSAEEFLRRFNPEPVDRLNIDWVQKQRGRYGEGGATRLRRVTYAVAGLLVLVLVGSLIYIASEVGLPFTDGEEAAFASTRVPTATPMPLLTPMVGDAFATPFDDPMAVLATSIPAGLDRGDPYRLVTPTAIYPDVERDVAYTVGLAANYYANGDYVTALEQLQAERQQSGRDCYPAVIYYEALTLASMGEFREAENTVQQALNTEAPRGSLVTCQNSPLLVAALGEITYMQDPRSDSALAYSEQALAANFDPPLPQANLTKARIQLARGELAEAERTVLRALEDWPEDTNFLLLEAQIKNANDQPQEALNYVGRILYLEPALLPALYLETDIYLHLAEHTESGDEREEYYGLAALSAQTIQLYYSGNPAGYLYLAKARLGEGKYDLVETELDRILAVRNSLPASAAPFLSEAYRVRGDLYYQQGRFDDARDDYEQVDETDPAAAARLVDIYLHQGEYQEAANKLELLLVNDPANTATYTLLQAKLRVEICTFYPEDLTCEYRDMLRQLTDEFAASLGSEAQQADAVSLRAQALYHDTVNRGPSLSDEERQQNYQHALDDLDRALAVRESAVDHYYRGLVLEELDEPLRAYDEYQWVMWWGELYPYPFADGDFEDRVDNLAEVVQEVVEAAAATPEPTEASRTPTATPTPRATSTPVPTATPRATPTPLPPDEIP